MSALIARKRRAHARWSPPDPTVTVRFEMDRRWRGCVLHTKIRRGSRVPPAHGCDDVTVPAVHTRPAGASPMQLANRARGRAVDSRPPLWWHPGLDPAGPLVMGGANSFSSGAARRPRRAQMIRRSRRLGILTAVGLLALAVWPSIGRAQAPAAQDTLQAVIKRGELIVGTFDFFPPWGFRDAQNNIVGMDVDIAKDLAEQMKVKLTLVAVPTAPDRINFLVAGKIDVAISNFTATVERSKTITFTEPYVIDGFGVIFNKAAKIKDWPNLNGKKVAVTTGSTGEILLTQKAPKAQALRFDQASAALLAVQQGKADAPDRGLHLHRVPRRPRSEEEPRVHREALRPEPVRVRCTQGRSGVAQLPELLHLQTPPERKDEGTLQEVVQRRAREGLT
jgi:hypothetical protein